MKKILATIICMAIMIAIPLGAMAQNSEPYPGDPDEPAYWEPYWWPEGGFEYSDGVANGTFVDFGLNETTGTITDYTARLVDYNFYYPMMYYDGMREGAPGTDSGYMPEPTDYTIKLFDTVEFEGFVPNGSPGVFGQSLVFLGQNVMMTFDDYEGGSMRFQFGNENDTVTFTVPNGIEVTQTPHYYELYDIPPEEDIGMVGGGTASYDSDFGVYYDPWHWTWDQVWLRSGNISCSIWVDRGTVNVTGNSIVIDTYPDAHVSTSTWIEYGWQYRYSGPWFAEYVPDDDRGAITSALESGLMGAMGVLFAGEGIRYSDSRAMNDPTFNLEFINVESNSFQVRVESEIRNGRIVSIDFNKEALRSDGPGDIRVLLDDDRVVKVNSMDELVQLQDGGMAGYYMISGSDQNTVFVYVPHFSTRIITVSLVDSVLGSVVLPAMVAGAFIVLAIVLVGMRGRRGRDEL